MIPSYNSFDWFASLLPLLIVGVPLAVLIGNGLVRRALIIASGLYLLALVAPRLALFHLVLWLVVAALVPVVSRTGERPLGKWVLTIALTIVLTPMVAWKIWPIEFIIDWNLWTNRPFRITDLSAAIEFTAPLIGPIGLSFSTFRAADLIIKSNLGLIADSDGTGPTHILAYGMFAPLLVVGPIAPYNEVRPMLVGAVKLTVDRFRHGVMLIVAGLLNVFVVAYLLDWSPQIFTNYDVNPPWRLWAGLFAFGWFFFANFAGYSSIAEGTGHLLGANISPNFRSPYTTTTPAAFWDRWHASLTRFLRTNVWTPIVGRHSNRQYAATALIMLLIGLWHSVSWASLVFGVYHGFGLIGHRILEQRRPAKNGLVRRWLKSVGIFLWFVLSLPLLQLDLADAAEFYGAIMGIG